MSTKEQLLIFFLVLIGSNTQCWAGSSFRIFAMDLQVIAVSERSGGSSVAPEVSWTPGIPLLLGFGLRGNLGASILKGPSRRFVMVEALGMLSIPLEFSTSLEVGGGVQNWIGNGGSVRTLAGSVRYHPTYRIWALIDALTVGAEYLFSKRRVVELKLGLGFDL